MYYTNYVRVCVQKYAHIRKHTNTQIESRSLKSYFSIKYRKVVSNYEYEYKKSWIVFYGTMYVGINEPSVYNEILFIKA